MNVVKIDREKFIKNIKPLHGVNGGPVTGNSHYEQQDFLKKQIFLFRVHMI